MTEDKLAEAQSVLEDLLRTTFPNTDFTSIRVWPDVDHDGDDVLRVDAFYRGSDAELDSPTGYGIITRIWDRLIDIGVTTFPIQTFRQVDEERYGHAS